MEPIQFRADSLLIVPQFFTSDELTYDVRLWRALLVHCQKDEQSLASITHSVLEAQLGAKKTSRQDSIFRGRIRSARQLDCLQWKAVAHDSEWSVSSAAIEWRKVLIGLIHKKKILDEYSVDPASARRYTFDGPALAGMTFAHEGYRMHNGYGGNKIGPSLDSLANLHVNAIAIVPYTFQRSHRRVEPFHLPKRGGAENDPSTRTSLRAAKKRGWFTLLKPQIWVGEDSWPGEIEPATEADWDAWFTYYRYWIIHYALVAEEEGVDALCIGTELVRTTLTHPDSWRALIADIRQVYSGCLTYAANWGEEFEQLEFWDDLDVIGLNSYYPLSKNANPSQSELDAGALAWLTMAAKVSRTHQKPLWLTEVGYRSVTTPWVNPHARAGDRKVDVQAQARCYRALTKAAGKTPELKGIFIWKWPSFLGRRKRGGRLTGFTPGGKPAAPTLAKFYLGWPTREPGT